jgi:ketosteroid isomerase-like protein
MLGGPRRRLARQLDHVNTNQMSQVFSPVESGNETLRQRGGGGCALLGGMRRSLAGSHMRHAGVFGSFLATFTMAVAACSPAPALPDEAGVRATLESFYGAMKTGDNAAAMRLIAPDAVFIESGRLETREQYENNHLPADIEFESMVAGKRGPMQIKFEGNAAWVIVSTEYVGTFQTEPVDFVSSQLMVLTRDPGVDAGAWRIRSIHWSSLRR